MRNVVFVAPFLMDATLRFVRAAASLPEIRMALLTQEPIEKIPDDLRSKLHAHWRVADCLSPDDIEAGVLELARHMGNVHRLVGTLEQLQTPLGEVRARLGIEGMDAETAENFRDKGRMKDALRAGGVPCAKHRKVTTLAEGREFALATGFPLVVKPPAGAGAKSTFRVESLDELDQSLRAMMTRPGQEVQLEEFVVGEENSFDTVSIGGQAVWHSLSHYRPTPLEVLRNPWIQWCVFIPREVDSPKFDDIRRVGSRALSVLGMRTGVSHMEWFRRRDGSIAISEVGCRPPGAQICSLISYAHDFDFYSAWARVAVFDQFTAPERKYSCGAAYLRGQGEGRVAAIHGIEQAQKELGALVIEAKLPQVGQAATNTYEGEGYVILRHPDSAVVEKALNRLVTLIRVELR
ncbi:MAG: ATP-grasp domain-containing protein [Planctomycetes bacterium]|nr:ATP-grasp domain-containing protein [Planctomycetota bacterium]